VVVSAQFTGSTTDSPDLHEYKKIREKIPINSVHLLVERQKICIGLIIRGHP